MAYRVIWSARAVEDVEGLATYIARDSPSYAATVVHKLLVAARDLQDCRPPEKKVPELPDPAIGEKSIFSYRLIYRVEGDWVTVAAIVHSQRLLALTE